MRHALSATAVSLILFATIITAAGCTLKIQLGASNEPINEYAKQCTSPETCKAADENLKQEMLEKTDKIIRQKSE